MAKAKRIGSDLNMTAFNTLNTFLDKTDAKALPLPEKNPAAVALGRLGSLKGGRARAESLTARERSEIAKKAAQARWKPDRRYISS